MIQVEESSAHYKIDSSPTHLVEDVPAGHTLAQLLRAVKRTEARTSKVSRAMIGKETQILESSLTRNERYGNN